MDSLGQQLLAASRLNQLAEVKVLIAKGANVNERNTFNDTSLHHAASSSGSEEVVKLLIASGIDLNATNGHGQTALHIAAHAGSNESALALTMAGADVNAQDMQIRTALHWAAKAGSPKMVLILLGAGADVNALEQHGNTPLDHADDSGTGKNALEKMTCLALIAYGAKCTHPDTRIHEFGSSGMTQRQAAVQGGLLDRLQVLLDDHPSSDPKDIPEALVKLAHQHAQSDAAAVLHAYMAARAIDAVLTPAPGLRSGTRK